MTDVERFYCIYENMVLTTLMTIRFSFFGYYLRKEHFLCKQNQEVKILDEIKHNKKE